MALTIICSVRKSPTMQRRTELRKLPAASLCNIANILEINNDWQRIVPLIPKDLQSDHFQRKYNYEHIRLIEEHAKNTNRKCAEVLFDEWGTSGRVRPTLETLMKLLYQAQIFRAVDEIANMLGEPPPPRPENGPAANITINLTELLNDDSVEQKLNSFDSVNSVNLNNSSHDQVMCNRTTRQLKHPSDLIKFSETIHTKDIPNLSALHTFGNQTTAQLKQSDLIKFSEPSLITSGELPDFSALIPKSNGVDPRSMNSLITATGTTERESSQVIMTPQLLQYGAGGSLASVPNIFSTIDSAILEDKNLVHFDYRELEAITNKFSEIFIDKPVGPIGKIGSGGFGEVYVGTHSKHGPLAVKRVRIHFQISCEIAMKVFNTEVKSLSHLRHENIVPIFGYSIDGPTPCIVCKYIDGGSLQQKIAAKVLTEHQRINIMRGTAEGLKYIHHSERPIQYDSETQSEFLTNRKSYYLHGDVKSANILLTKDCVPKLCDFGLAKQLETTFITTKSMMGTSAYMAPEGFSGTVTQKNDIFSFGIVLLELLTGLKPIVVANGENNNIKNYVEDNCENGDITSLLDNVVDKWTKAQEIYLLARRCLEHHKNNRPSIDEVCEIFVRICSDVLHAPV